MIGMAAMTGISIWARFGKTSRPKVTLHREPLDFRTEIWTMMNDGSKPMLIKSVHVDSKRLLFRTNGFLDPIDMSSISIEPGSSVSAEVDFCPTSVSIQFASGKVDSIDISKLSVSDTIRIKNL